MLGTARTLLAVCTIVQSVLWSQSKYAQPSYNYQLTTTLTERFSGPECQPLNFELPSDQCIHVRDICPTSETVLSIPYLQLYYCADSSIRPLIFTALLLWLAFLISTLGISASDFFTPNLATIAQCLGLNEDIAGVTFLAFGNASPDVFSTFSAMRANSGGLAIGELLGSASFIVSCIAGTVCIIHPFKVDRIPFLRDVGFFTVAICIVLFILWDGVMTAFESTLLIVWYVFYAFTVIIGGWWVSRREKRRCIEATARAENMDESQSQPYSDDSPPSSSNLTAPPIRSIPIRTRSASAPHIPRVQTQLPPTSRSHTPSSITSPSHLVQMHSFSLVGAMEFRQIIVSLQNQAASSSLRTFDSPLTPYAGDQYLAPHCQSCSRSISSRPLEPEEWNGALGVPPDDREREVLHEEQGTRTPLSIPTISSVTHTRASPTEAPTTNVEEQIPPTTPSQGPWHIIARTCDILFRSLHHFKSKTLVGKMVSLLAAPAAMALTITLPVVINFNGNNGSHEGKIDQHGTCLLEFEEEGVERALIAEHEVQKEFHQVGFNKWLTAVQCILGPLFCVTVLFSGNGHIKWLLAGTALGGFVIALLVLAFSGVSSHPAAQMARCSMGFFVSIVWIMAIADELVNVLQAFGIIFGLSEAIIGLTIFGVGNSLAELVANMSVAVSAPTMAFAACFGSPMINILLGIGISCTYVINESGGTPYDLHFTPTLIASTMGLLVVLLLTLVVVPMQGYVLSRRWGMFLILVYVVLMSANLVVEMSST